jgi:hypothetical protein
MERWALGDLLIFGHDVLMYSNMYVLLACTVAAGGELLAGYQVLHC